MKNNEKPEVPTPKGLGRSSFRSVKQAETVVSQTVGSVRDSSLNRTKTQSSAQAVSSALQKKYIISSKR